LFPKIRGFQITTRETGDFFQLISIAEYQGVPRVPGTPKLLADPDRRLRRTGRVLENRAQGAAAVERHEDVAGIAVIGDLADSAV
jgi:hypothetical protein